MDEIVSKHSHGKKLCDSVFQFYQPQEPIQLEVVFVHGLEDHNCGDAYWKTWLVRDGTPNNVWPMTWLSDEFSSTTVFALKYDTIIQQTATNGRMDLFLLGEKLVQELANFGEIGQNGVPVVFVCHGFGGLVAKQIVTSAKHRFSQDPKAQNLLKNIEAILFYSPPHHGSHLAKSSSYFYSFRGGGKGPLLETLEVLSTDVSCLDQDFIQVAKEHSWYLASAAETHITEPYDGMVVKEASSRYEGGNYLALSGDHFDIVRPKTKKDSSYLWLTNCLKEVLNRYTIKISPQVESLVPDGFVRFEAQEEAVKRKLQEVSIVGLVGMGGIGKTTLARAVYQSIHKEFERSCYLDDVKSKASLDEVLITLLQNFEIKDRKTGGIVERSALQDCKKSLLEDLKTYVKQHRVLVVVDDVGTKENLASLLKAMDFLNGNKESKVIVTCRNWQVLKDYVQQSGRYEVEPMRSGQDIELFIYHAFKGARTLWKRRETLLGFLSKDSSECLIDEFERTCDDVVKACGGLPLSLEVMGCYLGGYLMDGDLSSKDYLDCWRGALEKLVRAEPMEGGADNNRLWKVLQISYDCLHENEQDMFLDIACFFCDSVQYGEQTLLRIWGGEPSKLIKFRNLKERCLVKINEDGSVTMHDQLRDMGRNIVRRQCKGVLSRMTRLWDFEDTSKLVQSNEITAPHIQGLSLELCGFAPTTIMQDESARASKRQKSSKQKGISLDCPTMRLLNLYEVEKTVIEAISIEGSSCIHWLCLKGINIFELPKFVQVCSELRVLDMRNCKYLKNLDESIENLVNLLELNLSKCTNLVSLPNSLGDMVNLTKVDLSGCKRLTSLPNSIGKLVNLSALDISSCKGLTSLPNSIGMLFNLSVLYLRNCELLTSLPNSIGKLVKLLILGISGCKGLTSLPDSIGMLVNLSRFYLRNCEGLTCLPNSIGLLVNLSTLDVSGCQRLISLPNSIGKLVKLLKLDISNCKGLTSLPDSIGMFVNLSRLSLQNCERLTSLPNSIGMLVNLSALDISGCKGLTSLPNSIGVLCNLSRLSLRNCERLTSLSDSIGNLVKLLKLDISGCKGLTSLPNSIGNLVKLLKLDISSCKGLTSLPDSIGNLVNLLGLYLWNCEGLTTLPNSIGMLVNLSTLDISGCKRLTSLPDSIGKLVKLLKLDISGCKGLTCIPNSIGMLVNLSRLYLRTCEQLTSLPNFIGMLVNLSTLDISNCKGLTGLPDSIGMLVKLSILSLRNCERLTSLPNSIGMLVNLFTLDISGCKGLTSLPNSFGKLVNLSGLNLRNCEKLTSVPNSIGMLVNLFTLDISGCKGLTSLPNSIGKLVKLLKFDISGCKGLTSVPDSIGMLNNLFALDISSCEWLTSLPDSIGKLFNLSTLDISGCKRLKGLPDSIDKLTNLYKLDIFGCEELTNLPDSIGKYVNQSWLPLQDGMLEQELTLMDFLDMSRSRKSARDKDALLNSSTQQVGDLDTFQKYNRQHFRDILYTDGYHFLDQLDDEIMEDISKVQELEVEMMGLLPLHSSISAPDISNQLDYETMEDISKVQELEVEMMELLPLHSSISAPNILNQLDDETMEDVLKVQELEVEAMGVLPLHSSINAPDISNSWPRRGPANTKNKQPYQPVSSGHDMLSGSLDGALKFTMADLNIITGDFSESLTTGQRGSGSVYWGKLEDGTTVVVKRIKKIEAAKDFQIEIDTLSKEHLNLVRVLGFLEDENEQILVTEYVTNGNLRQHLDGVPYGVILDMSKRCRISLDVVAALRHLHNQTKDDLDIIHRNMKSSNILITNDFRAKVVGFCLSRRSPFGDVGASSSSPLVKGISGCMALEHSTTHHLKEQNDVYSFGELLVEIFAGKCLVESNLPSDECFTLRWVLKQCAEGRLTDIIDPKITPTTFNLKILEQILKLAASCLALKESNHPTVEDIFCDLSFIVSHYFGDLKDESNSKGDKYKLQEEQKWDPKACIEPNFQTLCMEELEVLKGQEPIQHLEKIDSSNPSFMPAKPHGSLFVEGLESNKVQTSMQFDSQLEVDSKQPSRQASELLVAKQDQTSPMFIDIVPDVLQLKSDETCFEMLQEKIAKLGYISGLLSLGDEFEQDLTNIGKTSFYLYFNEKDDVFEFYFKNYQGMASIVGVGLECAKVVLEDGWRVTIQEISKPNWDDAWKNFDSSTMKVTISEPLEEDVDNMEDSQEALAFIPKGQCLLLDLAQYFILKMAISSFLPRASMTHANTDSGTSSSSSSQDIAKSSSSSDQKPSRFYQVVKFFLSREGSNQLKTKNGDGIPMDPPSNDDMKNYTTVHLKLLPGGCLYDGSNLLDATIFDDKELKTLTSQLDNTICLEMMFKFLNKDDRKEIQVTIGPISFQFLEENEVNFEKNGRFGWYHKLLDVSFGPINASHSNIGLNHKALDIVDWKLIKTTGSSDATTRETSKSLNGEVKGSVPHILTLSSGGSSTWGNSKSESVNVGDSFETTSQMTHGGFHIFPKRYQLDSKLKYVYRAPNFQFDIDLQTLANEDYRKLDLNHLPMCIPQDVKFEGTWHPKELQGNPQGLVEYTLIASRMVYMTSKDISEKDVKKSWMKRCGHPKIQKVSNEPLKYTQKYARRFFLNHAMTNLNGEKFKVEEFLSDRSLNQIERETHLEDLSCYVRQWRENPLVELNSRLDYQP